MKKIVLVFILSCFAVLHCYAAGRDPRRSSHTQALSKKDSSAIVTKSPDFLSQLDLYRIQAVGAGGRALSMYDGSVWEISYWDESTVKRWQLDTRLSIMPNESWMSSHRYVLKNTSTNEKVSATLSIGPTVKYALFIREKNMAAGLIVLSDNTSWHIGYWDSLQNSVKKWQVGDAVFVGELDHLFSHSYVLLNINKKDYIPVDMY